MDTKEYQPSTEKQRKAEENQRNFSRFFTHNNRRQRGGYKTFSYFDYHARFLNSLKAQ